MYHNLQSRNRTDTIRVESPPWDVAVSEVFAALHEAARTRIGTEAGGGWMLARVVHLDGLVAAYQIRANDGQARSLHVLHPEHVEKAQPFLAAARAASVVAAPGAVVAQSVGMLNGTHATMLTPEIVGRPLTALMTEPLPASRTLDIGLALLKVLAEAHSHGVLHGDLRPSSIYLASDNDVQLLGLGLAPLREQLVEPLLDGKLPPEISAYAAPERSLGGATALDPRSDVFSVGALLFRLLTGRVVHRGDTDAQRTASAATMPAPPLMQVDSSVPERLAAAIDRALSFDAARRFADATQMHAALEACSTELNSGTVATGRASVVNPAIPPAPRAPTFDPPMTGDGQTIESAEVRELFRHFDRALTTRSHYGEDHPEWQRRFGDLCEMFAAALDSSAGGIEFEVFPYAFSVQGEPVWEPSGALQDVTYALFADGVRRIGLLPGMTRDEFAGLLSILMSDQLRLSLGDDMVTLLWDAGFEHIVYDAVDMFIETDDAERELFDGAVQETIKTVTDIVRHDLETSWQGARTASVGGEVPSPEVATPELVQTLGARLNDESQVTPRRMTHIAATALKAAQHLGNADLVLVPMAGEVERLAATSKAACLELLVSWVSSVRSIAPEHAFAAFNSVLSPTALKALLQPPLSLEETALKRLRSLIAHLGADHAPTLLEMLPSVVATRVETDIVAKLAEHVPSLEPGMGLMLQTCDGQVGVALIKLLRGAATKAAATALAQSAHNPHPIVRLEGLCGMGSDSATQSQGDIRALLEDPDREVRLAALRTVAEHRVRAAGPPLAMRIRSDEFDALDDHEKRDSMAALGSLAPARAEALCIELLSRTGVVSNDKRDATRVVAAEILASLPPNEAVLNALDATAAKRFRNSARVREAARQAATTVRASLVPSTDKERN